MTNDYRTQPPRRKKGAVGVIVRDCKLLVIRRSQSVVAPGMFCFPGGGIEDGETEQQALVRELQEELGVQVRPDRRIWQSVTPWGTELAWWLAHLEPDAVLRPDPKEVESTHWLDIREMSVMADLLESNHHFLAALASQEIVLECLAAPPDRDAATARPPGDSGG